MKSILVKKFGPLLGIVLCAVAILSVLVMPQGCQMSPDQRAVVIPLTTTALTLAERANYLPPGSSVTIGHGVAILTSEETQKQKLVKLADLGLAEAVKSGDLKPGDALLVNQLGTALVQLLPDQKAQPPAEGPQNPLLPAPPKE